MCQPGRTYTRVARALGSCGTPQQPDWPTQHRSGGRFLVEQTTVGETRASLSTWLRSLEMPFSVGVGQMALTLGVIVVFADVIPLAHVFPAAHGGFGAWDGAWYMLIAARGYQEKASAAFFPLYPLLIRLVHDGTPLTYLQSAMLIANVAFVSALAVLYSFVRRLYGLETAGRTVWLIAVFPTAFFFNVAYTESLMLLTVVAFFWFLQAGRWYYAMACAVAATLTHDTGFLLVLPALWVWWRREQVAPWQARGPAAARLLSIAAIPLALLAFIVFTDLRLHEGFAILAAHSNNWKRGLVVPVVSVIQSLLNITLHPKPGFDTNLQFMSAVNGIATLLVVGLTVTALIRRRTLEGTLLLTLTAMLVVSIMTGTVIGFPPVWSTVSYAREMVVIFPAFIVLARLLTRPSLFTAFVVLSLAMKVLLAGMFGDGFWVI